MKTAAAPVMEKALKLATADKEMNGDFLNSPYKIVHEGIHYKAAVRYRRTKGDASIPYLELVRPTELLGNADLPENILTEKRSLGEESQRLASDAETAQRLRPISNAWRDNGS